MMKRIVLFVLSLLSMQVWAVEYNRVQIAASSIHFVSRQMGVPVKGAFRGFSAQVAFDPAKLQKARASVEIDMSSVDAGSIEATEEVIGRNWFAVKQFPTARFETTRITALGNNRYQVTGRLTIRNVTREVSAPFIFRKGVFRGSFVLKRLDYGIGQGVWADVGAVADEVEILFNFVTFPS